MDTASVVLGFVSGEYCRPHLLFLETDCGNNIVWHPLVEHWGSVEAVNANVL